MTKRKCGETLFVYQSDGSDKTLKRINDAIPHTCIQQQIGVGAPMAYIQEMSAIRCPVVVKTVRFSD